MMSSTRALATAYGLLSLVALLMIPASAFSWWGFGPDPKSSGFATVLSMPWALVLGKLDSVSTWPSLILFALCMGANLAIIVMIGRWFRHRGESG